MSKHLSYPIWPALQAYHPDKPGVILPFSRRLAIENSWSRRYTLRTIEEYKRFAFLACTNTFQVTPSEAIDQTWHLHMVYTRSYWEDFCGTVLQRALHHSPTEGGNSEDNKYREQYSKTLALYEEIFGEAPPADIWLPVDQRFEGGLWRWINRKDFWVIRKPKFLKF